MKKHFVLSIISILFVFTCQSQTTQFAWSKQVGGTITPFTGTDLAVDFAGNVYTTGTFRGTIDFDPGSAVYSINSVGTTNNNFNAFITKSDNFGNLVWAHNIAGVSVGVSICVDNSGCVLVTGRFSGTIDFDPDTITSFFLSSVSSQDIFISKFDPYGNFIWAKRLGSLSGNEGVSVTTDINGYVYVSGHNHSPMDYDPGPGIYIPSYSGKTAFVLKLDGAGSFVWAKGFTCSYQIWATSVSVDLSGNVIVAGWFEGTADFDPDTLSSNIHISSGYRDIFSLKLNSAGNLVWVNCIGGINNDEAHSAAVDLLGSTYLIGSFQGTVDFDPSVTVNNMSSTILHGIFICKFDSIGTLVWAKKIDGNSYYTTYHTLDLKVDEESNIYATGRFVGTTDFDPGVNVFNLVASSTTDAFTLKLNSSGDFVWAYNIGDPSWIAATSIALDDFGNVYTSGRFQGTVDFDPDSTNYFLTSTYENDYFVMKMLQRIPTTSSVNVWECDSMISPSGNYIWNQSGIYEDTILNMFGLDSVISINLTIMNSTSQTVYQDACFSYDFNGTILYNSGTYYDTLQTYNGCDSLVTLHLNFIEIDTSVTQNANELTANAIGASYQWLDCANGLAPVAGATSQSFTPSVNGSYAVVVSENGCADTSSCYTVNTIGYPVRDPLSNIKIYPNPTFDKLSIDLGKPFDEAKIEVINLSGQTVIEKEIKNKQQLLIPLPSLTAGEYLVKISIPKKQAVVKWIIIE